TLAAPSKPGLTVREARDMSLFHSSTWGSTALPGDTMPSELRRSGVIGLLTASLVVGLGWTESALAQGQLPPSPPPVQLGTPAPSPPPPLLGPPPPPQPPATLPPALPGPLVVPPPPAIPSEPAAPSQVFPDGGFPTSPPAPRRGMPAAPTGPGAGAANAEPPPKGDYAPPGLYPRESQQPPGVGEFFRRMSAPLPDYVYQPAYYDTPGIGARA